LNEYLFDVSVEFVGDRTEINEFISDKIRAFLFGTEVEIHFRAEDYSGFKKLPLACGINLIN
jgi:hypothetical protein